VLGAVARRREQGEQQIHGPVVDRPIGDRGLQPHEDGRHPGDALQPGVRHRNARAEAGRAQGLALQQGLHDPAFRQVENMRGGLGHRMQGLTL